MTARERAHQAEHDLAKEIGFYSTRVWWIDSLTIDRKSHYYKYFVVGRNGMSGDEPIAWHVPQIAERSYAFALRLTQ